MTNLQCSSGRETVAELSKKVKEFFFLIGQESEGIYMEQLDNLPAA